MSYWQLLLKISYGHGLSTWCAVPNDTRCPKGALFQAWYPKKCAACFRGFIIVRDENEVELTGSWLSTTYTSCVELAYPRSRSVQGVHLTGYWGPSIHHSGSLHWYSDSVRPALFIVWSFRVILWVEEVNRCPRVAWILQWQRMRLSLPCSSPYNAHRMIQTTCKYMEYEVLSIDCDVNHPHRLSQPTLKEPLEQD